MALVRRCGRSPRSCYWTVDPTQTEIQRQPKTTGNASDSKEWVLTGRIDFVDPRSAGELVLQVEETRIVNRLSGVEQSRNSLAKGDIRRRQDGVGLFTMPNEIF